MFLHLALSSPKACVVTPGILLSCSELPGAAQSLLSKAGPRDQSMWHQILPFSLISFKYLIQRERVEVSSIFSDTGVPQGPLFVPVAALDLTHLRQQGEVGLPGVTQTWLSKLGLKVSSSDPSLSSLGTMHQP